MDKAFEVSPKGYSNNPEPDVINNTRVDDVISDDNSQNDVDDKSVIGLTRLFECTEDYYNSKRLDPDEFFEYTLYLVNHGATLDDGTKQNTDFYFGSRKLTDFIVVSEYPGNTEYPNDKIYLKPCYNEDNVVIGYDVYFKSNDIVVPLQTSSVSSISYNGESNYIQVVFKTEQGEVVPANILLVDDEGNLLPENLEAVTDSIVNSIVESGVLDMYWDYI